VADGLSLRGAALTRLSRPDEAIAIYDEIVKRYGEDSDEELRLVVALVLWYKADLLRESDPRERLGVRRPRGPLRRRDRAGDPHAHRQRACDERPFA
jgi:hypothetical protein